MLRLPLAALVFALSTALLCAEEPNQLQKFIDEAIKAGKGTVTVPPGTYTLPRGLMLKDAKQIAIGGMDRDRCILKLPPLAFAECSTDIPPGGTEIPTSRLQNVTVGMRLWIEAPGAVDKFTKKPANYHLATVKTVEPGRILLTEPLRYAVPAKTYIRDADAANLIEIRGKSDGILLANLTLDGGRTPEDPPVRGHAQLCAIFAAGAYDYEEGPADPKVKTVTVENCIIQNCFGRGVAFYSVEKVRVERCTFMDINDEAVDFDHFTEKGEARGNHISRCRVAFELNDANDILIIGNEVRGCDTGVNLWRWCKQEDLNEGNRIFNNAFLNIAGNAIQLGKDTSLNSVANNDITGCGKNGIVIAGEQQTVEDNRISDVKGKDVAK